MDWQKVVKSHLSIPEDLKRKMELAHKSCIIVETLPPDSPYIQKWEGFMHDETVTLYTACKNGIYPLTADGSVYFGDERELHLVRELNGFPCNPKAHLQEWWLMRRLSPDPLDWMVVDDNLVMRYGPFASLTTAINHIKDENYSVEGVWSSL